MTRTLVSTVSLTRLERTVWVKMTSTRSPGNTSPEMLEVALIRNETARNPGRRTAAKKPRLPGLTSRPEDTGSPAVIARRTTAPTNKGRSGSRMDPSEDAPSEVRTGALRSADLVTATDSMAQDIATWLDELDLGRYVNLFAENEIDFVALPHISENDLKEIGVALGARRKLLAAIAKLQPAPETPPRADPAAFQSRVPGVLDQGCAEDGLQEPLPPGRSVRAVELAHPPGLTPDRPGRTLFRAFLQSCGVAPMLAWKDP